MVESTSFSSLIYEKSYIPRQAYLIFPDDDESNRYDSWQIAKKHRVRRIFEGKRQYTEMEKLKLKEFKEHLEKSKVTLSKWWDDANLLRFLYARNFNCEKTMKLVVAHAEWREKTLPPKLTPILEELMNKKGICYLHGRDHRFRPIAILNVGRMNTKEIDVNLLIELCTFFLTYMIEQILLPGQIENWVWIIDLQNKGISELPLSMLKTAIEYMQNNFQSRLFNMYILNAPKSIYITWKLIKGFIDELTVQKIKIFNTSIVEEMFTHVNKSQLEKKYGGECPTLEENFWPPKVPSSNYFVQKNDEKELLITEEAYITQLNSGDLTRDYKICPDFLKSPNVKKSKAISNNDILLTEHDF